MNVGVHFRRRDGSAHGYVCRLIELPRRGDDITILNGDGELVERGRVTMVRHLLGMTGDYAAGGQMIEITVQAVDAGSLLR